MAKRGPYIRIDIIHLILLAAENHRDRMKRNERGICIISSEQFPFPALTSAPVRRHIPSVVESGFERNVAIASPRVSRGASFMTSKTVHMAIALAKLRNKTTIAMWVLNCNRQICGSCWA